MQCIRLSRKEKKRQFFGWICSVRMYLDVSYESRNETPSDVPVLYSA